MITLRYHIVSVTAVFLAIGIGLTLGSTFLDRATVDNLNGQLESLEARLGERDQRIGALQDELAGASEVQDALDAQASGLLADRLDGVPVVVLSARGADDAQIDGAVQALLVAGARLQGEWWFTERFLLTQEADVRDLAAALGSSSEDPARLRRSAVASLGGELRLRQQRGLPAGDPGAGTGDPATGDPDGATTTTESTTTTAPTTVPDGADPAGPAGDDAGEGGDAPASGADALVPPLVSQLTAAGFIDFQPVPGSAETPQFPDGTRIVVVGGSRLVPDDVVLVPLVERLARAASTPMLGVVSSASDDGDLSDAVAVVREDESLRSGVATVGTLAHFQDWAALVLALGDVADGVVGHYGLGEGAGRLLPPLRAP